MKNILALFCLLFLFSCASEDNTRLLNSSTDKTSAESVLSDFSAVPGGGNGNGSDPGLITAGEWRDLEEWNFWKDLLSANDFMDKPDYWQFYPKHRVSVEVNQNFEVPVSNVKVALQKHGSVIWETYTDNQGKAELWIDLYTPNEFITLSNYSLLIDNTMPVSEVKLFEQGINKINYSLATPISNEVQLSFIVDATGSMGDEMEFLKDDLEDVISRVESNNRNLDIYTSSVFYRDEGDDYVVKHSEFTANIAETISYIQAQSAGGGGDFPEAVHTGLSTALEELSWSENAKSRIAFLLLDAPPHYTPEIITELQELIAKSAQKGIKLVPITASGIDKETEFLMRFFSIATNGTYVFITDDSGIGNSHLQASVGEFEVEFLNKLLVRLIGEYTE